MQTALCCSNLFFVEKMEQNHLTKHFNYAIIYVYRLRAKFFECEEMRMNAYKLIPKLVVAALDCDRKSIEALGLMISREIKKEYPEIAKEIIQSLSIDSFRAERSLDMQPVPVDKESRYELVNIKTPIDIMQPILNDKTLKQINDFLCERHAINELLENDIIPPNSLLLFGMPGVGKTYIANWLSSELSIPLVTLDLASSISSYLGRTGQNIHNIFEYARSQNAILFLDELDAIAKRRDDMSDLGELKRMVNVLLKELEECSYSCIIIGATNHPELLDKAIWRRFDRAIEIPMPTESERKGLINRHLEGFIGKISKHVIDYLVKNTNNVNAADTCKLCEHIKRRIVLDKDTRTDLIALQELFTNKPIEGKELKAKMCIEIKQKFPDLSQRDIAQITQIPLSSVSRYLNNHRKEDES